MITIDKATALNIIDWLEAYNNTLYYSKKELDNTIELLRELIKQ
jgi:hypothetical protein